MPALNITSTTVLCCALMIVPGPAKVESSNVEPPRLLWEKTFEGNVISVGVDRDLIKDAKDEISPRLRWICLEVGRTTELHWIGKGNEQIGDALRASVVRSSANGRFLMVTDGDTRSGEFRYRLMDCEGRKIWEKKDQPWFSAGVRCDGSSVLVSQGRTNVLGPIKFVNTLGKVTGTLDSLQYRDLFPMYSTSENFFALTHRTFGGPQRAYLFDRTGRLVWEKEWHPAIGIFGPITVSDDGHAFLYMREWAAALVYDPAGSLVDSLGIACLVNWKSMSFGEMVLVSSWGCYGAATKEKVGNRLFCYDFRQKSLRFLLEDTTYHFGNFDVDVQNGLVAVAIQRESEPGDGLDGLWRKGPAAVRIYDLEGERKSEIPVEAPINLDHFWVKLLDGGVMIPERDKLRLYAIPER